MTKERYIKINKDFFKPFKFKINIPKCTCNYHTSKNFIDESGLIHNKNCPKNTAEYIGRNFGNAIKKLSEK